MTSKKQWAHFEDRVREIAGYIWGRPCNPARVGGVNIDGVAILEPEIRCFVEITEERTLNKVREDVIKLQTAKSAAFSDGIMARCFCVVNGPITSAMTEAAAPHRINVLSIDDFTKHFFDFPTYQAIRADSPFGSAINPITGASDETKYVPVKYKVEGRKGDITSIELAEMIRNGHNIILLGEYGSGKSRCIREVFRHLSETAVTDCCHPVAVDLRKSWGLRQGGELIRRHFHDLGLDSLEASAIKAFRLKSLVFLLDGFDEIGSQAWSNDGARLKLIRAKSLEGVKDIVQSNGGGVLVAGREHYFPSVEEMYSALGMSRDNAIVVRSKNEFSDSELLEYFQNRDIDVEIPSWLPKRPLICQTIGELPAKELEDMFGDQGDEVAFWNHFISILCQRDANIHVSFDANTILRILIQLARLTRTKGANVGPISLGELQEAFELATGAAPVEEASIMLQRLPSLGRVGPESNDRQFVDIYILDGLRAKDIARIGKISEVEIAEAAAARWTNPLDDLGQKVLAGDESLAESSKMNIAREAIKYGNRILASDIISSLSRKKADNVDFGGIGLVGGEFLLFCLDERPMSNLTLRDTWFGELAMPVRSCSNVKIENCAAAKVTGISSASALPRWISRLLADEYESVSSVSRIRKIGLKPSQEILITFIRKTFFQKGSGRKEEALLRGLGTVASKSLSNRILNIMIRQGLLKTFKGDEGTVYAPVRSNANRMQKILDELTASQDDLWKEVSDLK